MTSKKEKSCFVVMPITDMEGYEKGHFKRVYEHIIKPACKIAGFNAVRADDVATSNYIVIDILSKIIESEMVICDLSGRNPNVLYELGIRQAFNLPTVLLKDKCTPRIFDIQGLRTYEYDESLRIDNVNGDIPSIAKTMTETEKAKGKDINSIIQLLGLKPAKLPETRELTGETSVIMSAINELSKRISNSTNLANNPTVAYEKKNKSIFPSNTHIINGFECIAGEVIYGKNGPIGVLKSVTSSGGVVLSTDMGLELIDNTADDYIFLHPAPF